MTLAMRHLLRHLAVAGSATSHQIRAMHFAPATIRALRRRKLIGVVSMGKPQIFTITDAKTAVVVPL